MQGGGALKQGKASWESAVSLCVPLPTTGFSFHIRIIMSKLASLYPGTKQKEICFTNPDLQRKRKERGVILPVNWKFPSELIVLNTRVDLYIVCEFPSTVYRKYKVSLAQLCCGRNRGEWRKDMEASVRGFPLAKLVTNGASERLSDRSGVCRSP